MLRRTSLFAVAVSAMVCSAPPAQELLQPLTAVVHATPVPPAGPDLPAPPRGLVLPDHNRAGTPHPKMGPLGGPQPARVPVSFPNTSLRASGGDYAEFINQAVVGAGPPNTVGEPSVAMASASNGFFTGNHHAARTTDGGQTWTGVNPFTRFGSGFCCDQRVISHPSGVSIWLLQFISPNGNYHKLAVADTAADLGNGTFSRSFDINATYFGLTGDLDYPDVAITDTDLYLATNVYGPVNFYSVAYRIPIADLLTGTLHVSFFRSSDPGGTTGGIGGELYRYSQTDGGYDTMYFASHGATTGELRLYRWAPGGLAIQTRTIDTWARGPYVDLCPNGVDWLSRYDGRILGGYQTLSEIGFLWCSSPIGNYTRPHIRIARIDKATMTVSRQRVISFTDTSVAYPAVAPNAAGHLGLVFAMGGGTRYPLIAAALVDDINTWDGGLSIQFVRQGNAAPNPHPTSGVAQFGDYYTVAPKLADDQMTFVGTGLTQQGGGANSQSEPRFVHFGRQAFEEGFAGLIVRSDPVGVPITLSPADVFGQSSGTAPFYRKYPNNSGVSLTAPPTFTDGNGVRWVFEQWAHKVLPDETRSWILQPIGMTNLSIASLGTSTDAAEARYVRGFTAVASSYGQGCPTPPVFYELFDGNNPFDLSGRAFEMQANPAGGWTVRAAPGASIDARFSNNLGLADDGLSSGNPLGFTLGLPGAGSATTVDVDSNGRIGFGLTGSDFSESVSEFLAENMIAALWDDLDPTAGGAVYFDQLANVTLVTWDQVPEYNSTNPNTFQVQIYPSGNVIVVYGAIASQDSIVGYSPGGAPSDPGSTDISASMPFFTGSGLPVTLTATASPLIGTTINLDSANLPPNTVLGGVSIGFSQINLPLAPLGAPGCFSLTNGNLTTLRLGASSSVALPIPNDANILGVSVYLQTAAVAPSTNALGVVTSNGLQLTLGNI